MTSYKLPVYTMEELESANSYPPLECGRYKFRVLECKQGFSKNNNPQEQLILEVQHLPSKTMRCYHNFTFNNPGDKGHIWLVGKAKKFLDCIGVEYTEEAFDRVINREGIADFFVTEYTSKKDGKQKEKFIVPDEGFLSSDDLKKSEVPKPTATEEKFNDDIPF